MVALALDGGGIRGLVSITTLLFISRRLFGNERLADHVDWMAGTSTGSMLVLALTKGMTLTECFHQYIKVSNNHAFFIDIWLVVVGVAIENEVRIEDTL